MILISLVEQMNQIIFVLCFRVISGLGPIFGHLWDARFRFVSFGLVWLPSGARWCDGRHRSPAGQFYLLVSATQPGLSLRPGGSRGRQRAVRLRLQRPRTAGVLTDGSEYSFPKCEQETDSTSLLNPDLLRGLWAVPFNLLIEISHL